MSSDLVMRIIMAAQDKASAAMQRVRNASNGLSGSLNELERELQDVAKAQKMVEQRNQLQHQMQRNSRAILENRQALKALNDEISRAGTPTKKQAQELERLTQQGEKLKQSQARQGQKLEQLNADLRRYGVTARHAADAQAQLNSRHDAAASRLDRHRAAQERLARAQQRAAKAEKRLQSAEEWNDRLSTVGGTAAIGAAGIGAAMSVPIREYAKAESAAMELRVAMMDNIGKVPPEFAKIDALATSLGDRLPGTTADFKQLMTMLIRQGVSAQTILGGTGEAAALLAVQLKKPPAEAAEMAAKLQDATRATEKEMMGLMDRVQKLYYMGVDDNNILGAFAKLSPALDITKLKGEQAIKTFSPLIGMLDQAGLSGESAGNALRKVFSLAMDTKKINKATKGTGIELDFTNGKGEFGGIEQTYAQLAKLQKLNTEQRLKVLKDIFGDDAETLQALNTMIEKGQAGYNEFAAKMDKQASLQQRVNQTLGTVANLWDSATGSFTNFMVAMGEAIASEIRFVVDMIDKLSTSLGAWARENPQTANTILKVAAGIGVLLAVVAVLAGAIGAVILPMAMMSWGWAQLGVAFASGIGVFSKVATALRIAGAAMLGFGKAAVMFLFTNPFGWVILAVGLLYLLWRNWDKVKNALITGWNYIKQVFRNNPFLGAFTGPIGMMLSLAANWDRVKAALIAGWQAISTRFANNPVVRFAMQSIGAVRTFAAIFGGIPNIVAAIMGAAGSALGNAIAGMMARIRGFSPVSAFQAAFSAALAYLRGLGGQMAAAGAAMIEGLLSGIRSRIGAVSGLLAQLRGMVANFRMPSLPSISSIKSAVGFSRGGYTGAGGVNEAAGIVHRGEVVFSQRDVARFGGWQAVERLRLGGANMLERISGSLKLGNNLGDDSRPKLSGNVLPRPVVGGGRSGSLNMAGDNITINIHAAPNMDVRQLADLVMQKLQRQQHKQQIRANSAFYDKD